MFIQPLQKVGDDYSVLIPDEIVERHGWREGQLLEIRLEATDGSSVIGADILDAIDERWERNEPALRYLADR